MEGDEHGYATTTKDSANACTDDQRRCSIFVKIVIGRSVLFDLYIVFTLKEELNVIIKFDH